MPHNQEDSRQRRRIEVRTDLTEVDFAAEHSRLVTVLDQATYEFRIHHGGHHDNIAVIRHLHRPSADYTITSREDGKIRIVADDESYAFEADFADGAQPTIRQYIADADAITETEPGEDEAGCRIIAAATRLLLWANIPETEA